MRGCWQEQALLCGRYDQSRFLSATNQIVFLKIKTKLKMDMNENFTFRKYKYSWNWLTFLTTDIPFLP